MTKIVPILFTCFAIFVLSQSSAPTSLPASPTLPEPAPAVFDPLPELQSTLDAFRVELNELRRENADLKVALELARQQPVSISSPPENCGNGNCSPARVFRPAARVVSYSQPQQASSRPQRRFRGKVFPNAPWNN